MKSLLLILAGTLLLSPLRAQSMSGDSATLPTVTYYAPSIDSDVASTAPSYSDTIITNDGRFVKCTITEISPEVVYFKVDTLPEVICVVTTSSVFKIKYANGTSDLGSNLVTPDYYAMGRADGHEYYKSRDAVAGTFVSGALFWFFGAGIVSGIAITAVPPKKLHNEMNPNDRLLNTNQDYYDGFRRSARNKKVLHSSLGFVGGVAAIVGFVTILIVSY